MKSFLLLCSVVTVVFVLSYSCISDPIIVEFEGDPIDTTQMDTLILLVEENICTEGVISIEREILPLVVSGCAYSGCHDAITHEEGVVLETYGQIMKEVKTNNPGGSELYKVLVKNMNDEEFMPPLPAISFTEDQIQLIKDWINQGAPNTDCKVPCNSENASFTNDVWPIIANQCLGCHQPSNSLGDVNLEDFVHVRSFALTGQLLGSLNHTNGYTVMPETSLKLTDCQIATIQNWMTEGVQDN